MLKNTIAHRSLLWVVGLALLIRLISVASLPLRLADDTHSYIDKGVEMVTNTITLPINFGPLYALLSGGTAVTFGEQPALTLLRLLQAVLGALTCGFVWRMAYRLTRDPRVATIAGLGIALNPIFIIENNALTSETLFIFLLAWGLSLYVAAPGSPRALAGVGGLLALATLTRAMLLLFPLGLAVHLFLTCPWRRAVRGTTVLLVIYGAVLGTWTLYNVRHFNRVIIGASGMGDFLLMGAVGYNGASAVDAAYAQNNGGQVPTGEQRNLVALNAVSSSILSNPLGYVSARTRQLIDALLQPHQTPYFPGESLKALAANWLSQDRSLSGLVKLVSGDAFWPKLSLYAAHYIALVFGALGLFVTRRQWKAFAPLSGLLAYTLLLHFFLLALPRYLFPMMPALWVFAAIALVWLWDRLKTRGRLPHPVTPPMSTSVPLRREGEPEGSPARIDSPLHKVESGRG
jgi:4-amino-4-deoxy-L-arabinose transferase-like glycosyltransferase